MQVQTTFHLKCRILGGRHWYRRDDLKRNQTSQYLQEGKFNYKTASEAQFNLERVHHSESKSLVQTLLDLKITELKNTKLKQSKEKY